MRNMAVFDKVNKNGGALTVSPGGLRFPEKQWTAFKAGSVAHCMLEANQR